MSPREEVARGIADTCVCAGLNDSYGVLVNKVEAEKSYWAVTFCKARILDGEVRVYSPRFILVKWQTAIGTMAPKGSQRFDSDLEVKRWLVNNFVNRVAEGSPIRLGGGRWAWNGEEHKCCGPACHGCPGCDYY